MTNIQQEVREALEALPETSFARAVGLELDANGQPAFEWIQAQGKMWDEGTDLWVLDAEDRAKIEAVLTRAGEEIGDKTWTCPECAFRFGAEHEDGGGGYSCPNCAEAALRARVAELEEALTQASQAGLRAMDHVEEQARKVFALRARVEELEKVVAETLRQLDYNPMLAVGMLVGHYLGGEDHLRALAASEGGEG